MFKSNDYYNFEDFKVGSAVVCYYQNKKYVGIITHREEYYLHIFWEGDDSVSEHSKYHFDSGRKSFALLKDWKKYKEQMKDDW